MPEVAQKSFLKSKTIWGVAVMMIGAFVPQVAVVHNHLPEILEILGAGLAAYGRIKADIKLGVTDGKGPQG